MVDEFGARIAKLRKARNLSQRALVDRAKALDPNLRLSHSALGSYERNSTVPRLAEAVALADVLDVSLDFLLRGEAYRTLPLKNLTDEQTQLLLDLSVYFRQQNSSDREKKEYGTHQRTGGVICKVDERSVRINSMQHDAFLRSCCIFCIRAVFLVILFRN